MIRLKSKPEVIIAGGGPVGVALALELSLFKINTLIIERHQKILQLPRGPLLNPRTLELFKRWGIAEEIKKRQHDYSCPIAMAWCNNLAGKLYAYVPMRDNEKLADMTPQKFQRLPLWVTEEILRKKAKQSNYIQMILGWTVKEVEQNDSHATVLIEETHGKKIKKINTAYIVGCDGANSTVRKSADISLERQSNATPVKQIIFRSPQLGDKIKFPKATLYHINMPDFFGAIGYIDGNLWFAQIVATSKAPIDHPNIVELLQKFTGFSLDMDLTYWFEMI